MGSFHSEIIKRKRESRERTARPTFPRANRQAIARFTPIIIDERNRQLTCKGSRARVAKLRRLVAQSEGRRWGAMEENSVSARS
jgi:hypothetical protein